MILEKIFLIIKLQWKSEFWKQQTPFKREKKTGRNDDHISSGVNTTAWGSHVLMTIRIFKQHPAVFVF